MCSRAYRITCPDKVFSRGRGEKGAAIKCVTPRIVIVKRQRLSSGILLSVCLRIKAPPFSSSLSAANVSYRFAHCCPKGTRCAMHARVLGASNSKWYANTETWNAPYQFSDWSRCCFTFLHELFGRLTRQTFVRTVIKYETIRINYLEHNLKTFVLSYSLLK